MWTVVGAPWVQKISPATRYHNTFVFLLVFFFFPPNKHTHKHLPDTIKMPSPLRQVAWECGDCATTNRGREQLPCSYCRAENPRRYEILAGSAPAATARTTYVMRPEQHDIVRALSEAFVPHSSSSFEHIGCVRGCVQDVSCAGPGYTSINVGTGTALTSRPSKMN